MFGMKRKMFSPDATCLGCAALASWAWPFIVGGFCAGVCIWLSLLFEGKGVLVGRASLATCLRVRTPDIVTNSELYSSTNIWYFVLSPDRRACQFTRMRCLS